MADWASYKPILTALALPPVPFLILILVGARLILPRRGVGYLVLLLGVSGIWFSSCHVTAVWLQNLALHAPHALYGEAQSRLAADGRAYQQQRRAGKTVAPPAAIIVLGAGREALAPEYGVSDLTDRSFARLRYGVWLSRQTGLPLGFSGGVGWSQKSADEGPAEAEVAARLAEQQFGVRLQWVENASSDTRGNAALTVAMLAQQGVPEVVLVSDASHMHRAQRAFMEAAREVAVTHPDWTGVKVTPAPTGYWRLGERPVLDWLPSQEGVSHVRLACREMLGWLVGS